MEERKFEYLWKTGVLIILLFSMIFLGYQLRDFTIEGKMCLEQPYLYAENNTEKYGSPLDYCLHQLNQKESEPKHIFPAFD